MLKRLLLLAALPPKLAVCHMFLENHHTTNVRRRGRHTRKGLQVKSPPPHHHTPWWDTTWHSTMALIFQIKPTFCCTSKAICRSPVRPRPATPPFERTYHARGRQTHKLLDGRFERTQPPTMRSFALTFLTVLLCAAETKSFVCSPQSPRVGSQLRLENRIAG